MSSLKENRTCALLEQYLSYLTVVKGRSSDAMLSTGMRITPQTQ